MEITFRTSKNYNSQEPEINQLALIKFRLTITEDGNQLKQYMLVKTSQSCVMF